MKYKAAQGMAVAGLTAMTVIWGTTFILVKWTVAAVDVYYFLFLRFLVASLLLMLIFHQHLRKTTRESIRASFIMSLFLFGIYATQTEGLRFTTASNSALITGLYLVLIPLFSMMFLGKRTKLLPTLGAVTSVIGLYLLTNYSLSGFNIGDGITLICSAMCAFHVLLTGHFTTKHRLIPLVLFQFLFVTAYSGMTAAIKMSYTVHMPPVAWLTIVVTGALATALAFTVQTAAQRLVEPTRAGIIFALEAVFGALFAYLIGGEMLTATSFIGACLMICGMVIAEIKPVARYLIDKIAG